MITATPFPGTRIRDGVAFVIGSKAYVGLGNEINSGTRTTEFWEFDPSKL